MHHDFSEWYKFEYPNDAFDSLTEMYDHQAIALGGWNAANASRQARLDEQKIEVLKLLAQRISDRAIDGLIDKETIALLLQQR